MKRLRLDPTRQREATIAARHIRSQMDALDGLRGKTPGLAFQLGTGWGDAVKLHGSVVIRFREIPGFSWLKKLNGHSRLLEIGFLDPSCEGSPVAVLRGRIHMFEEPSGNRVPRAVRLQVAMLFELGVEKIVLTCAAGSLDPDIHVGDLALIGDFVMIGNEVMPTEGDDDFVSPEDALESRWTAAATDAARTAGLRIRVGVSHAYVRGKCLEGRRRDKPNMRALGAGTVGMSVKPETSIAALYGVPVLAVAYVSNDMVEKHDDAEVARRVRATGEKLGAFLTALAPSLT